VVKEKRFLRNVFVTGLLIRLLWVIYLYFVFNPNHFGNTFGDTADTEWYMAFGRDLAAWMRGDVALPLSGVIDRNMSAIDDVGYPMWLGVIYLLTGDISDVFIPFVVKSIVGAYCATLVYRVAKRHFGIGAARIAAIFVCLNPNMIYWCGTMMKEAEMVFVVCLAVDKLDEALSSGKKLTFRALLPGMLAGLYLFFFRDVLGIALFLGVAAHVVMASNKVLSLGKKIIAGVLIAATLLVAMGDRLLTRSEQLLEKVQSDAQKENMEWRGEREGGNEYAKYAGAAVFAPLIFTIPFPTFNQALEGQLLQVQLSGGSYIKNILSFFVIVVLLLFLASGEWRKHVFIIAYTCAYLVVLIFSGFAQSGRFHMPIWPMLMLFAAYGVQLARGNKRLRMGFILVLILEVIVCLGWNWFKLKGRGMI
jgi:4-amino-4-deoxy-L-arabinose transferase-like glycosyltransferase